MSNDQERDDYDDDNNFVDTSLDDDAYELDFNDSKAMKRQHRAKSRTNARRRLEDYFERKALKEQEDEWDYNLDY